jgi:hypothetical protein
MSCNKDQERLLADFSTLLLYAWYRDFPVDSLWRVATSGRADWTLHIASSVRFATSMMGYFLHCEDSARTDGVVRDNKGIQISAIEWEWNQLAHPGFNEIDKLRQRVGNDGGFATLICYVSDRDRGIELANVASAWRGALGPLLVVAITFAGKVRAFKQIVILRIDGSTGDTQELRTAAALPWQCVNTRWEVATGAAAPTPDPAREASEEHKA